MNRVERDGFIKEGGTTYVEIRPNNSFAVSRTSGDIVGVYKLKGNRLELHSYDNTFFNTNWELSSASHILEWHGLEVGYGNVFLKFNKVDKIPDFSDFSNALVGRWQLYKTRTKQEVKQITDTWFIIDEQEHFQIIEGNKILEEGNASINPRHHKVVFENDQISWNAWFYGEELRLENKRLGLQYSLRRTKRE